MAETCVGVWGVGVLYLFVLFPVDYKACYWTGDMPLCSIDFSVLTVLNSLLCGTNDGGHFERFLQTCLQVARYRVESRVADRDVKSSRDVKSICNEHSYMLKTCWNFILLAAYSLIHRS